MTPSIKSLSPTHSSNHPRHLWSWDSWLKGTRVGRQITLCTFESPPSPYFYHVGHLENNGQSGTPIKGHSLVGGPAMVPVPIQLSLTHSCPNTMCFEQSIFRIWGSRVVARPPIEATWLPPSCYKYPWCVELKHTHHSYSNHQKF